MEHLEWVALQTTTLPQKLWLRYVYNTFVVWPCEWEELDNFYEHLNRQHPNIKFNVEVEKDNKLAFLDVQVTRSDTMLNNHVYYKPTHTNCYIPFHSCHHARTVTGVLRCLRDRANWICDSTSKTTEHQSLQDIFQCNGLPMDLVRKTLSRKRHSPPSPDVELLKILCLPYVRGFIEGMERGCTS